MNGNKVIAQEAPENAQPQCENCKELEIAVGIFFLAAFIGPIIGILIGLFAGKKLIEKKPNPKEE